MSAAQGLYAETVSDVTTTDSSQGFLDCASISAGSFTANKKYLILACGYFSSTSATDDLTIRLVHGTTPTVFTDGSYLIEAAGDGANAGIHATWLYVFEQPGTAEQVKIQFSTPSAADATCHMSQIFALKLSDDFTENTDWFYNEVTTLYTHTTSFVDQANVTFTPDGSDDWLILAHGVADIGINTAQCEYRLDDSVVGAMEPLCSVEGEATTEVKPTLLVRAYTPSAASHNIAIQARDESVGNATLSSRIFILNLNKFRQHFVEYTEAEASLTSASFVNAETKAITPEVTGNWFYIGALTHDCAGISNELLLRLQDDDDGSLGSDPAYGDDQPQDWANDTTDEGTFHVFKMKSLTSGGSRTINWDAGGEASVTSAIEDRSLIGFSLELAGAGAFTLTADSGSFVETGTAAALRAARKINGDSGSYTLSGTAAALKVGRKVVASSDSFSVNGTAASLRATRLLAANLGNYSISGQAAGLGVGRKIVANAGSHLVTGQSAALVASRKLAANSANYSVVGTAAGVLAGRKIIANAGAYAWAGQDANLIFEGADKTLVADPGSFTIGGSAAQLVAARKLTASASSYSIAGVAAGVIAGRKLAAGVASYSVGGSVAGVVANRKIVGQPGSYLWTGTSADLIRTGGAAAVSIVFTAKQTTRVFTAEAREHFEAQEHSRILTARDS